jgi:hypothetical protein
VPEKDRALKIHYPRIPMTRGGVSFAENRDCVIVEFRFVSLVNVYLKRIWYACLGYVSSNNNQPDVFVRICIAMTVLCGCVSSSRSALHGETRQALG